MGTLWSRNFIFVLISIFSASVSFYILIPTLPLYLDRDLGFSTDQIGPLLATYTLASLLTRPFFGFLLDRYGRKSTFLLSVIFFTLLFPCYAFVSHVAWFYLLRFMHGIAWAGVTASAATSAVDLVPSQQRAVGLGYYSIAIPLAYSIGPALGIQLVDMISFSSLFLWAGIFVVPAIVCTACLRFPRYNQLPVKFSFRRLLEPSTLPLGVTSFLYNISYGGLSSYVALYAIEITDARAGLFFTIMALSIAVSRLFSGRLYKLGSPQQICTLSFISLSLGFLLLGALHFRLGFYLSALFIGLGYGVVNPIFQTLINNLVPFNRRGAANSTLTTMADTGNGVGMVLSGVLGTYIGYAHTFMLYAMLIVATLLLFVVYSMRRYYALLTLKGEKEKVI